MTTRFQELQAKIALRGAISDIESNCVPTNEDGSEAIGTGHGSTCWYDINRIQETDGHAQEFVSDAIEYLDGCGLLKRHPMHAHWVRPMDHTINMSGAIT